MTKPEKKDLIHPRTHWGNLKVGDLDKALNHRGNLDYNKAIDEYEAWILSIIEDDAYAMTFQTMGQYRTAIKKRIGGTK